MKRPIVTAFKPHSQGLAKLFGSLESDIMELIWARGHLTARDVFEGLRDQGQRLSYGAVKTVLDRLAKKQVLVREMSGNQYTYHARLSREEYTGSAVREIIGSLLDSFGDPVVAHFLDEVRAAGPDRLRQLNQLISEAEAREQPR